MSNTAVEHSGNMLPKDSGDISLQRKYAAKIQWKNTVEIRYQIQRQNTVKIRYQNSVVKDSDKDV